jgi:hypothetical protein
MFNSWTLELVVDSSVKFRSNIIFYGLYTKPLFDFIIYKIVFIVSLLSRNI